MSYILTVNKSLNLLLRMNLLLKIVNVLLTICTTMLLKATNTSLTPDLVWANDITTPNIMNNHDQSGCFSSIF